MTNILLVLFIMLGLLFAVYDQFVMDKLKGKTKLCLPLKKQKTTDTWLLIGLIALSVAYGVQNEIAPLTLYLLCGCILVLTYLTFFRQPRLLLKEQGFFFASFYFDYHKIYQINVAEEVKTEANSVHKILVIDLHGGRRLLAYFQNDEELQKAVSFFGGYKVNTP